MYALRPAEAIGWGYRHGENDLSISDAPEISEEQRPVADGMNRQKTAHEERGLRSAIDADESQGEHLPQTESHQDGLSTSVLQKVISNNKDAMNILFEAALQEESNEAGRQEERPNPRDISSAPSTIREVTEPDVLRIWNACRFVKMGWFSAHEAMVLVDLFFANMNPLSPILTDFFASHTSQFFLVTQEPMLCCTILMISSRYHTLPGAGGCSRAFFIHNRLWQHCQHLLLRLMLGQEKISKAKTRNIGSIEALLLMAEWHPRALQFPPDTDGWDSDFILTNPDGRDPPSRTEEMPVSDRWREDVVEPTKRFERMSWMALNSALALAHELGVFDLGLWLEKQDDSMGADAEMYVEHLERRRERIPSLLFVFINALSSRIGCTSPMPSHASLVFQELIGSSQSDNSKEWLRFMAAWIELTKLTTAVTDSFKSLINFGWPSGMADTALEILEGRQISLANWRQRNLRSTRPGSTFSDILFIEYQNLRILINSIGMQRIVQRVLVEFPFMRASTIDSTFLEEARKLNMTGREYGFIEEVIDGCCQTLEKATALADTGILHYSPMRLLFRTISASIFLLKALALGVRNGKLQEALQILDRAIAALQDTDQHDDVHLKTRYADLLKTQVSRLQRSLASSFSVTSGLNEMPSSTFFPVSNYGEGVSDFTSSNMNDWIALPLDPSMAPFNSSDGIVEARLDGIGLDLDFLWQLPP
ncbi:hypothetical protein NUU61_004411 [Penicillium alfredii]|uniref:Transcription factor domain-containing protein n=1 Tax=Penicillium alfredii TaxID=1506179 RepID=A0A9W9FL18_9EURO|nr:uncharacterized protein NUU61_004411 [Penicillium alfredii]KAJ5102189.1 hypothetical protein NUU61_004411 [Penicillium alfredii]